MQVNHLKSQAYLDSPWVSLFFKLLSAIEYGSITLVTPDGQSLQFAGDKSGSHPQIRINDWGFCEKLFMRGDIGLGESYIDGDWDSEGIHALIRFGIENKSCLERLIKGNILRIFFYRLKHLFNRNTKSGSERNIHAHYDLGNDFYSLWLDKSMTYSSALFDKSEDLASAQTRKYERIFETLNLKNGDHVLEVGCGWGGFMEYAATRGVHITGVTISKEQFDFASKRLVDFENANVKYCDYRNLDGKYDYIVSIEMFEALGYEYWKTYFNKLAGLLKDGGKIAIQSITINDDDFKSYKRGTDFIQQYIFPGGLLSASKEFQRVSSVCGLKLVDEFRFGKDYGKTLDFWDKLFVQKIDDVKKLGFDEKFIRTWRFYFKYCQGGFEAQKIGVSQFLLEKAE
ncbi:cyclopropane-fatty-acyl-phospholipid synthase [Bacteriovorax sp. DB6_IX]|nr:cyclopropane-fatty-acyl-phospholipid synthase [Bacteriovorax sp. DB6_IX]